MKLKHLKYWIYFNRWNTFYPSKTIRQVWFSRILRTISIMQHRKIKKEEYKEASNLIRCEYIMLIHEHDTLYFSRLVFRYDFSENMLQVSWYHIISHNKCATKGNFLQGRLSYILWIKYRLWYFALDKSNIVRHNTECIFWVSLCTGFIQWKT